MNVISSTNPQYHNGVSVLRRLHADLEKDTSNVFLADLYSCTVDLFLDKVYAKNATIVYPHDEEVWNMVKEFNKTWSKTLVRALVLGETPTITLNNASSRERAMFGRIMQLVYNLDAHALPIISIQTSDTTSINMHPYKISLRPNVNDDTTAVSSPSLKDVHYSFMISGITGTQTIAAVLQTVVAELVKNDINIVNTLIWPNGTNIVIMIPAGSQVTQVVESVLSIIQGVDDTVTITYAPVSHNKTLK